MTRSHYLPAAYVGGFSGDSGRRRDRRVWLLRRGADGPSLERASKVLRVRDLYVPAVGGKVDLESFWQRYESKLPTALDRLTAGTRLDALTWIHVLVPFVTGALLRGPEFDRRFRARLPGLNQYVDRDSINSARLFEFQRLLAPVLAARWVVLEATDTDFVGSDVGWIHGSEQGAGHVGIAVVLGPRHALLLVPSRTRAVVWWDGTGWAALVDRGVLVAGSADSLNDLQARRAERVIFSRSRESVAALRAALSGPRAEAPEPTSAWGLDSWTLVSHEFEWWRLARVLRMKPSEIVDFDVDFSVADGAHWWPPVLLPANLPEFRSGLAIDGNLVTLTLGEPGSLR